MFLAPTETLNVKNANFLLLCSEYARKMVKLWTVAWRHRCGILVCVLLSGYQQWLLILLFSFQFLALAPLCGARSQLIISVGVISKVMQLNHQPWEVLLCCCLSLNAMGHVIVISFWLHVSTQDPLQLPLNLLDNCHLSMLQRNISILLYLLTTEDKLMKQI